MEDEDALLGSGIAPSILDLLDASTITRLDNGESMLQGRGLLIGHVKQQAKKQQSQEDIHDERGRGKGVDGDAGFDAVAAATGGGVLGSEAATGTTDLPAGVGPICDVHLSLLPVDMASCLWSHPADAYSLGAAAHDGMPGAARIPLVPDASPGALSCLALVARATLLSVCTRLAAARAARSQMAAKCSNDDDSEPNTATGSFARTPPPLFTALDVASAVLSVLRSDAVAETKDVF